MGAISVSKVDKFVFRGMKVPFRTPILLTAKEEHLAPSFTGKGGTRPLVRGRFRSMVQSDLSKSAMGSGKFPTASYQRGKH